MNASDLIRRYWAGGYHFGNDSQFEKFVKNEQWKIGWSIEDKEGKPFYQKIKEIKIGDFFALKSLGGNYDLVISALGIVIDTTEKPSGVLRVKWLRINQLYKGKAPKGIGAGNWFGTLLEVKRIEDIAQIFDPLFQPEEEEIRMLTANSDAFDFWEDEREDIYQDYLKKRN
jgi:hypothetical protein